MRPDPTAYRSIALSLAAIAGFMIFTYHGGENSYVRTTDFLDGYVPSFALLAQLPIVGGLNDTIVPIFNGLPRNSMPSSVNAGFLPYYFFDPFAALVINEVLVRVLALLGMVLLLRKYLLPEGEDYVIYGASLCFALLPFYPPGYLCVAGQPLLLYAILNLYQRRTSFSDWLVIVVFTSYSNLIYVGLFIVPFIGLLALYDLLRTRRINVSLVVAAALMGMVYVASEYRLLYQTLLDPDYISNRAEIFKAGSSFPWAIRRGLWSFLMSHKHAPSVQSPFILLAIASALAMAFVPIWRSHGGKAARILLEALRSRSPSTSSRAVELTLIVALCGIVACLFGLWYWAPVQELRRASALTRMIGLHRIQWFHPALFGLAFGYALLVISRNPRFGRTLAVLLIASQGFWLVGNSNAAHERQLTGMTYRQFYSPALFEEIADYIGKPQADYRVVSVGLQPGIALYNGFYVLDSFQNDYPLEYKHRFRRVIAPELAKNPQFKRNFDEFGARVVIYSSELGKVGQYQKHIYSKSDPKRKIDNLDISVPALRELGAGYILSSVEVGNHEPLGLTFEKAFEREDSPWQVFLYSLTP